MRWVFLGLFFSASVYAIDCHRAILNTPISDNDEMMFQQLIYNALDDVTSSEVRVAFYSLAEYPWAQNFVKSPNYGPLLRQITEHAIELHFDKFEAPDPDAVEKTYDKFLAYQLLFNLEQKDFHEMYCQAASDAAAYFLEFEKFGLVQKYDDKLDEFGCAGEYHSWKRVNPTIELRLKK